MEEWEIFFIEEVEFDPDLKGWLTCVWSKGRGGAGDGHSAIPSFSRSVWNLSCVLGTELGTSDIQESNTHLPRGKVEKMTFLLFCE